MKKSCFAALAILWVVIHLGSCQSQHTVRTEIATVQPLKGYELYSWWIDQEWHFALVPGTNRIKSHDEVTSSELTVQGTQALKRQLDLLPTGVQVFWSARRVPDMALPPNSIVKQISAHCERLGVVLSIDGVPTSSSAIPARESPVTSPGRVDAGRPGPTVTQVSEPPSTPVRSVTSPTVQTPECEGHVATLTIVPSATVLEVGETVTVTASLANVGCVDLGMPQYRLAVRSSSGQPIFEPNPPAPVLHVAGVHPGVYDAAAFALQAVGVGQAMLSATASFEVHLGYPGPAYWGGVGSEPLTITVLSHPQEPVTAALQTMTATPGLPAPSSSLAGAPPSLLVHKMAEPRTTHPNGVITYTIIMMNDQLDGPDPGVSVMLTDDIPSCTTYISGTASSGAHYDAVADRIVWVGAVQRGLSAAVSFKVQVRDCALADRGIENVALVTDALGLMSERCAYVPVKDALPLVPASTPTGVSPPMGAAPVPHPSPTKKPTAEDWGGRLDPYPLPATAEVPAQGDWVRYPSLNNIRSLAFAPDGALWAGTDSGVVRWDLVTDTYYHYSVADGLASDDVTGLAFAPDETLWIATRGGVSRFDGARWTTFTEADGLASNIVYAIAAASDESVWAGTQSGASLFDGSAWTRYTATDGLAADLVWHVAAAPDGDVWFSTHTGGVSRYDPARDAWMTYGTGEGLPAPNARFLTTGPDGAPWLHVGYHHVYRFDGTSWRLAYEAGGGRWVCDIDFDANGLPWIATCGGYRAYGAGLAYLDGETWTHITTEDGLLDNDVTAVAAGRGGIMAAGSDRGLSVYQAGEWRALRAGPTLNEVTAVAVTLDGAAWFGFGDAAFHPAGGGLSRFDGRSWRYLSRRSGFPISENVRALALAPAGALWAGAGCGAVRLDNPADVSTVDQAWQTIAACDDLHGNVHTVAFASNGSAWIATDFDLYHLSGQEWTVYESRAPTALAIAPDNTLWVAHSPLAGGELSAFDGREWITHTERLPIEPPVTALVVTGDGAVWAGAQHGGLARYDGQCWTEYGMADGLPSERIVDLVVAPDDVLWAITDEGLVHFNGDAWQSVWLGHDCGALNAMGFAPDGSVWLGTSRGAVHFQPQHGPT